MGNLNDFLDADELLAGEELSLSLEEASTALDASLQVFEEIHLGASRREAEIAAAAGLLDTDIIPVEAFTVRPSSLNSEPLMLGILSGIANVIASVLKAVWKVITLLLRAVTAPFRWAYRLITGDSGGSGGGGGGGGGGGISSRMDGLTGKLEKQANEIDEMIDRAGIDINKVDPTVEKYLESLPTDGLDSSGIGSVRNYIGAIRRAADSLPPGVYDALVGINPILDKMGIFNDKTGKDPAPNVDMVRHILTARLMLEDRMTNIMCDRLFREQWVSKFSDIERDGKNGRTLKGFRGTRREVREMFFYIASSPKAEPAEYVKQVDVDKRFMDIDLEFMRYHRFHAFRYQVVDMGNTRRLPVLDELATTLDEIDLDNFTSYAAELDRMFDEFKHHPFWDEVKAELDRLTIPDSSPDMAQRNQNLDVIHNLNSGKYRENINKLWSDIDNHVFNNGSHNYFYEKMGKDPTEHTSDPMQGSELIIEWNGPNKTRTPHHLVGLAYTLMSRKERQSYNIDDRRMERIFNKLTPGGTVELPSESYQSIYLVQTLQNLVQECRANGWKDEADGYQRLLGVVQDNINCNAKIAKFAHLLQTYFKAVATALWSGYNQWLLNVQEMYAVLISYSIIAECEPERHIKEVEELIGKKLTTEERTGIVEQFLSFEPSTPMIPPVTLAMLGKYMSTDQMTEDDMAKAVDISDKFIRHAERGHKNRMRMIAKYMNINRRAKYDKPVDLTMKEIKDILADNGLRDVARGKRKLKAETSISQIPYKKEWTRPLKISNSLQDWIDDPSTQFPRHDDPDITDAMRDNWEMIYIKHVLRLRIADMEADLARHPDDDNLKEEYEIMIKAMKDDIRSIDQGGYVGHHRR